MIKEEVTDFKEFK